MTMKLLVGVLLLARVAQGWVAPSEEDETEMDASPLRATGQQPFFPSVVSKKVMIILMACLSLVVIAT